MVNIRHENRESIIYTSLGKNVASLGKRGRQSPAGKLTVIKTKNDVPCAAVNHPKVYFHYLVTQRISTLSPPTHLTSPSPLSSKILSQIINNKCTLLPCNIHHLAHGALARKLTVLAIIALFSRQQRCSSPRI